MHLKGSCFPALFLLATTACSKTEDASKPEPGPAKAARAPKEQMADTYAEIFQEGPMVPVPDRIKAFVDKVGAPKRVEGGKRLWFVRDAANRCHQVTLADSGNLETMQILDQAHADAECGPAK